MTNTLLPSLDVGPISILLVEDDPTDAQLMADALAAAPVRLGEPTFTLECVDRMSTCLARLVEGGVDVLLLELSLPDGTGIETLIRVRKHAPDVPIVVLTSLDDEALALQAIQAGAQDYLIKGRMTRDLLVRAIRYARERHRAQRVLRDLACVDSLTNLYNRRGFLGLCEQPLALAQRSGRGLVLFLVDVDDMKQINDTYGHQMGDRALVDTASILRATFRRSDIVARLGGDEFAVLSVDLLPHQVEPLVARLHRSVEAHNSARTVGYQLSLSVGFAVFEGPPTTTIDELMAQADGALYVHKRGKRPACSAPEGGGSRIATSVAASCLSDVIGWSPAHQLMSAMAHQRERVPLADRCDPGDGGQEPKCARPVSRP